MKEGARQRRPVRTSRNFKRTLLASALCAALFAASGAQHAHAQDPVVRPPASFDRGSTSPHFDGRMIRAQQRAARQANPSEHDPRPAMQPVQHVDQTLPARPPCHTAVMTADERRLLRQHIEEAVRDLYKR